ncbi:MAG: hypothetical protein MI924_34890 [Chloroflexales bacterium]|nr:hypothetical protein [Chloroflexales bacterium]
MLVLRWLADEDVDAFDNSVADHTIPMNSTDFNAYWNEHFADCPPVGYLLRDAYPERWFRIHTPP